MAPTPGSDVSPCRQAAGDERWSLFRRFTFRFFFCYWLLYALPEPGRVSIIPFGEAMFGWFSHLRHAVAGWTATRFFHVPDAVAKYVPTGSGDTTLEYVQLLMHVAVALVVTLTRSVLRRNDSDHRHLDAWFRVLLRYSLAFALFAYGFPKVVPLQFHAPRPVRLMEPFGEFSPMGVLWAFMGTSLPYQILSGCAEIAAGTFLLFRRTYVFGAVLAFAVMLNVTLLNYCYDVPQKLYSTHLTLMAACLIAPHFVRLANVLLFSRSASAADLNELRFNRKWVRVASIACWIGVVGFHVVSNGMVAWNGYQSEYRHPVLFPRYGLYNVESGPPKWRKVAVHGPQVIAVRDVDDNVKIYPAEKAKWTDVDSEHVLLEGRFDGASSVVKLRRVDYQKMPIFSRGFHWISERPFNR